MPASKIAAGARGLPGAGTEPGPPDRITALGRCAANASAARSKGTISQ